MTNLSHRHHYIPQMYQRGFADTNEFVWVFDRQNNTYAHRHVVNTLVKNDFYTVTDSNGKKSDVVEKMLANMVEGPTTRIIERLDGKNLNWEGEDREILALFVALLKTRNLAFNRDQNEMTDQLQRWWAKVKHPTPGAVGDSLRHFEKQTGEDMSDLSAQDIFEMIRDDQYEIRNPRQNSIKMMLNLSLEIAQVLFHLNWEILTAPKGAAFISCDNPFTVVPPPFFDSTLQGYGIMTPGASTVVPLSSKTAICFHGEGDRVRGAVVYRNFLRNTNMVVAANTERFVIARDEALLRSIVRKTKVDQTPPNPRFKINAPDPYAPRSTEETVS